MITSGNIFKVIVKGQAFGIVDSSNLAPIEEGTTATKDYEEGVYVIFDGTLCITNTAIATGTPLVKGENVIVVQVGTEMLSLKDQIVTGLREVNQRIDDYRIPVADAETIGGVKIGSGVNIDAGGKISVPAYNLPTASSSIKGGVKVNSSNGMYVSGDQLYLNTASSGQKGGVRVGYYSESGLYMNGQDIYMRTAGSSYKGGVRVNGRCLEMDGEYIKLSRIYYNSATISTSWDLSAGYAYEQIFDVYDSTLARAIYEGRGCIYGVETGSSLAISIQAVYSYSTSRCQVRLACNVPANSSYWIGNIYIRYWYWSNY